MNPLFERRFLFQRLFLAFGCIALAAAAPVASAKGTGLVVSPKPGQSIGGDHVGIVV